MHRRAKSVSPDPSDHTVPDPSRSHKDSRTSEPVCDHIAESRAHHEQDEDAGSNLQQTFLLAMKNVEKHG